MTMPYWKLFNNLRITWRLLVAIVLSTGLIIGALAWYSYALAERIFEQDVLDAARDAAVAAAEKIAARQRSVERSVQGMALAMDYYALSDDNPYSFLEKVLRQNPNVYGAALAVVPEDGTEEKLDFCPYVFRQKEGFMQRDLADNRYRYREWPWYKLPLERKAPLWTEPYEDVGGGGILMTTYAMPVSTDKGGKKSRFILGADLSLAELAELINTIPAGAHGYAFLVSPQGKNIAHTQPSQVLQQAIHSPGGNGERFQGVLVAPYVSELNGKSGWLMTVPVEATGWWFGVFFAKDDLLARIVSFSRVQLSMAVGGFCFLLFAAAVIARGITRPLRQLEEATRGLAAGNLGVSLPIAEGEDEVASLSRAFQKMQKDLQQYIDRLTESTQMQERIASDLRIAHDIQMNMVPRVFPALPQYSQVDIHPFLRPAKEVGGDFYDFRVLSDRKICLVIGDVSGKGVPAALFMAAACTLFKSLVAEAAGPAAVAARLNAELCRDNDACMFVTLFCIYIDIETGVCRYVNAGHNPPLLCHKESGVRILACTGGMAIGIMAEAPYLEQELILAPGEQLLLYTDGLTEAETATGELYGLQQACAVLAAKPGASSKATVDALYQDVLRHVGGAYQSDDITLLAFQYKSGDAGVE